MKRIKRLPFYIKGIIVVVLAAGLVVAASAGLKLMEEKQQKPRVLGAVASLAAGLSDGRYSLKRSQELLESGRLVCSGKMSVKHIEEELIGERYRFMAPYLQNTSFGYTIRRDEEKKKADFRVNAALYGVMPVEMEGYLDEKDCVVHIPGFHESYLAFSSDNMKAQYESSLLYTVLGDRFSLPQEDLADYVFFEIDKNVGGEETWKEKLEKSAKLAGELYMEIDVEKTKQKEDILWNGSYESCTVYEVSVPTEIFSSILSDMAPFWGAWGSEYPVMVEGESIPVEVSLNSDRRLLKLKLDGTLLADGQRVPVSVVFYPKGVENPWDSVLFTLGVTWDGTVYEFQLVGSNEFGENGRILHTSLSMTRPYVTEIVDADMEFDADTGGMSLDFACRTPVVTMDGVLELSGLEGEIEKPEKEAVRIFELNIFEILRFTNGLNWNFFKNQ